MTVENSKISMFVTIYVYETVQCILLATIRSPLICIIMTT